MLKVTIKEPTEKGDPQSSIKLMMRRNLNGDYMIFDHVDMDIMVKPSKNQIMAMAKENVENTDILYDGQNRFFQYLIQKGIVDPESVEGGDLYGTMVGDYYESDESPNATQAAIFTIGKFMEEEKPFMIFRKAQEELELDRYADPDEEYSTELGTVPASVQKGSIDAGGTQSTGANYRVYEQLITKEVGELIQEVIQKGTKTKKDFTD